MTTNEKLIRNKLGLLELAEHLGNVSKACKVLGFSRDTFYRVKDAYEEGGSEALKEISRKKPNYKNRVAESIENRICELAIENPALGPVRAMNELRKENIFLSHTGIRGIWQRNNLETMKKRLIALEDKVAKEGFVLSEAQVQALEKAKAEKEAYGEIETLHPGYLGSQDTFYVGCLKGIGRIYQQTYVDTYSRHAICKLYTMRSALTSADILNDKVIPFYEEHNIPVLRILTDRGTEYCGSAETHEFQLFLALNDIDHTKTKTKSPQTNGICERFHRTILEEFYQVTLRKKLYMTLEELQIDLEAWLDYYNNQRTHQGKRCDGRTPMNTFLEDKPVVSDNFVTTDYTNFVMKDNIEKESNFDTI